jgi:hypothetical protein
MEKDLAGSHFEEGRIAAYTTKRERESRCGCRYSSSSDCCTKFEQRTINDAPLPCCQMFIQLHGRK